MTNWTWLADLARRFAGRPTPTDPHANCRCGHTEAVHEHYRDGSDCGVCGRSTCHGYRPQPRRLAELAVTVLIEQAWQRAQTRDHAGAERVVWAIAERGPNALCALLDHCAERIVSANKAAAGWPANAPVHAVWPSYQTHQGDLLAFEQLVDADMWAADYVRFWATGRAEQERALFALLDEQAQHERAVALLVMATRTCAALEAER